jgi:hypothetical protein
MKTKLMAMMLLAGGALMAETHVSIGVNLGGPVGYRPAPPPQVAVAYRAASPGPGYVWVDGYYDEYGAWYEGYWTLPPYTGAYWMAPRYDGGRFVAGFWNGPRGVYRDTRHVDRFVERRDTVHSAPVYRNDRGSNYGHSSNNDRGANNDRGRGNSGDRNRDFGHGFRR